MNKKSFFLGALTGIVLTLASIFIIYMVEQDSDDTSVQHFEKPVSYENKEETSFKVIQVFEDSALAQEALNKNSTSYIGNTVLILGENYYTNQIITIKNPLIFGTYSYISVNNTPMTVPVIDGDIIQRSDDPAHTHPMTVPVIDGDIIIE